MPFGVSTRPWSSLAPELLALTRRFSIDRATRGADGRITEAWWERAERTSPPSSAFAFSGEYESPLAIALEGVLDSELLLGEWKRAGRRASQVLHLAPFLFRADDNGRWVQLATDTGASVMLGNPVSLMEGWPGAYLDDEGRAFKDRSARALADVGARRWPAQVDARAEQATLAVTYALHELLWEAWAQCVPVVVQW